jgi:hypothetical protein
LRDLARGLVGDAPFPEVRVAVLQPADESSV